MTITRIVRLPAHNGLLLGIDKQNIFKPGHVYSVEIVLDEIILRDLGMSALPPKGVYPCALSTVDSIIDAGDGRVYFTKEEWKQHESNLSGQTDA